MASTATLSDSRSYINDSCESLRSAFSGSSAPGSPVTGQLFYDTDNNQVSMYGASSWYMLFTCDSTYGGLVPRAGGLSYAMTGDLYMGGNIIQNVGDPSADTDAATKGWTNTNYLKLAGDTMTGVIACGSYLPTASADPTSDTQLARKAYVDLHVEKGGDTMSGDLDFASTHTCTSLAAPSSPDDAATMAYVDAEFHTTTGHEHDGSDAKKVEYDNLAATSNAVWAFTEITPGEVVIGREFARTSSETAVGLSLVAMTTLATVSLTVTANEPRIVMFGAVFEVGDSYRCAWQVRRDSTVIADDNSSGYWTAETLVFAVADTDTSGGSVTYTFEAQAGVGTFNALHPWLVVI